MLLDIEIRLPATMLEGERSRCEDRATALFGGYTWNGVVLGPCGQRSAVLCLTIDSLSDVALCVSFAREMGQVMALDSVPMRLPCAGFSEHVASR